MGLVAYNPTIELGSFGSWIDGWIDGLIGSEWIYDIWIYYCMIYQ